MSNIKLTAMRTNLFKSLIIIGLFLVIFSVEDSSSQDSLSLKSEMLDVKLQLLDSKLELLDMKIKLWEAKPKDLDIKLSELGKKIDSMDFEPHEVNKKFREIDSVLNTRQEPVYFVEPQPQQFIEPVEEYVYSYKSAIMLDPVRLFEGTFYLSYERILNNRFSLNIGGMATYSTQQGISNFYFSNQSFAFYDSESGIYNPFEGEVMAGGGVNIQFRNYLLASSPGKLQAPLGLYAAPQVMYRKMLITGNYLELEEVEPGVEEMVEKSITQHLNIFAGGVIIGIKVPIFKVLTADVFAGGNIRMSKYTDEDSFTKYKNWFNIDFSGVSPVAGIAIGILK